MNTNVLVRHKKLKTLGIGCISRVLKRHVVVNWGFHYAAKHLPSVLETVDVSGCKTMSFAKFRSITISNPPEDHTVIVGNELKHYVGIGWVTHRVVTPDDLKKYPRVID